MGKKKGLPGKKYFEQNFYKYTLVAELVLTFLVFTLLTGGTFISTRNLSNLLMQGTTCSIISITMMMVIVTCNSDLSAGCAVGMLGTLAAWLQVYANWGAAASMAAMLAAGLLIGLWHGYWIAYRGLPAFIVTYASQLLLKGITLFIGEGKSIGPVLESFSFLGSEYLPAIGGIEGFNLLSLLITIAVVIVYIISQIHGRKTKVKRGLAVPSAGRAALNIGIVSILIFGVSSIMIFYKGFSYAVIILCVLAFIFDFVINNTTFGRYVFAIGGNVEAAKLSGINTEKTICMIYVLQGVVVALASMVFLGRVGQAASTGGTGFEFTAITGCVVGGTSILGGRGTVVGAIIGTMLMAALDNGMSILNLDSTYQYLIKGLVLMLAIAMDVAMKNKKK